MPSAEGEIYLVPNSLDHPSLDYIYKGAASVFYFPRETGDLDFLAREVESAIAATENLSTVKVIQLNNVHVGWIGNDTGRVAVLLGKYAQYVDTEHFNDFRIHNYTNVSMERRWTFYERLAPLTVEYDGGISLMGFALGQGEKEHSVSWQFELGRDRPFWVALNWEPLRELEVDYSASLRLYSAEGDVVFQEDTHLWNPLHQPTSSWTQGERTETLFQFRLPPEIASGSYDLRLIVYNIEDLAPTVQVGVWEPVLSLANVEIGEAGE